MVELTFLQQLSLVLVGVVTAGIMGIVGYHLRKKGECFTFLKKTAYDSKNDIGLIKKFLVIQSRMIDDSTKANHPKDILKLQELAKQMFNGK